MQRHAIKGHATDGHAITGHAISRRELLKAGGAALAAAAAPSILRAGTADDKPAKVLFFTKSSGFEHSVIHRKDGELGHAEKVLIELGKKHGLDVTASKDGRLFDEDLGKWDLFVFYTSGDLREVGRDDAPAMSEKGKAALLEAVKSGTGFVASHCASDSFHTPGDRFENQDEKDPYIAMLGGEFIRHGPQQKARMRVTSPSFPGMKPAGESFELHEEWYSLKNFAPDLHVLLVNETEGMKGKDYQRPPFPATWARQHGKGRVFYTSMGHREDVWTNPLFQSIFVGGIHWALGKAEAKIEPNIDKVTPKASEMPPK